MANIVVTAIFKPKQDKIQTLLEELEKVAQASKQEAGCIQYELHQSLEDDTILLYEMWEDSEAIQNHINSDHYIAYRENTANLLESRDVYKLKKI